jgi:hypothetical protein
VEASTWPAEYRVLLLAMLEKNQFGTELWLSQRKLSHILGRSYSTVRRMMGRLRDGHRFGKKNIVHCEGVLEKTIDPNLRPHGKLRRSTTYRLHRHKLQLRPTEEQLESRSVGALCPLPARPESPKPAQPASPGHRGTERKAQEPQLKRSECAKLATDIAVLMHGSSGHVEKLSGLAVKYGPDDPRYRPRMSFRAALAAVSAAWKRTPESVLEAIKFWGYKFEDSS